MWIHTTAWKHTNNKYLRIYYLQFFLHGWKCPMCGSMCILWADMISFWPISLGSSAGFSANSNPRLVADFLPILIILLYNESQKRNTVYASIILKKWKAAKLRSPIFAAACWGMFAFITEIASMQNLLKYTFLYTICISVDFCRLFSLLTARSDFCVCSAIVNVPGNVWFGA